MKNLITLTLITFLFSGTMAEAQYSLGSQDSLVKVLMNRHLAISQVKRTMSGYRVQIYFGSQRAKATEVKTDFLQLFPKTGAYLSYQQPNFKIRVGDFKTRLEAMKFLKEIQPVYGSAFLVKDEVKLPTD
jgi:hypothetical protein